MTSLPQISHVSLHREKLKHTSGLAYNIEVSGDKRRKIRSARNSSRRYISAARIYMRARVSQRSCDRPRVYLAPLAQPFAILAT